MASMSKRWYFEMRKDARDFAMGEAGYHESYMIGWDEERQMYFAEIFGRRD